MSGIMMLLLAGVKKAVVDPFFNYVTLLLPGNGTNGAQNNTFVDSSTNNFTITRNGNTTQGTFSPFSQTGWSNYFDGNGDYLTVADNAAFEMTADFTIEAWFYLDSLPGAGGYANIITKGAVGIYQPYYIFVNPVGSLLFYSSSTGSSWNIASGVSFGTITTGQWYHVAVSRSGTSLRMFLNGALVNTITNGNALYNNTTAVAVGARSDGTEDEFNGYIYDVRLVKGTAVYTAAFTPPTAPLTAISGTSLLTCQSNRFIDNSSNAFAITVNGNTSVQAFSPFNPTAAWSAATNGGSGYFDGSGDYLNTPSSGQFAPTGDFTVAWWYYPTALQTTVMVANYTGDNPTDWSFDTDSTGDFNVYLNGATERITASGVVKLNAWNYFVVSRSGSTVTAYCNNASAGTYTLSGTFGSASKAIRIGVGGAGTNNMVGYCAGVSLIDGTALDGTIPTAPPTAISGTELLLNFTNAGIYDATAKNDLETVGNAQISTTQSKFGGSSMYFDGTGDNLAAANNPNLDFGTGDFTIECWVYFNDLSNNKIIIEKWTSGQSGGWSFYYRNPNGQSITFYVGSTVILQDPSAATISTGTWYHVAVARSGSTVKLFIDGSEKDSATLTTSLNNTSPLNIGSEKSTSTNYFNGYIQDLRITKGVARYTTGFTPPTEPFPIQ